MVLRLCFVCLGSYFESMLVIGYLSRASEKLIEHRTLLTAIPFTDRLDYVSCVCQEEVFYCPA